MSPHLYKKRKGGPAAEKEVDVFGLCSTAPLGQCLK